MSVLFLLNTLFFSCDDRHERDSLFCVFYVYRYT